MTLHDWLLASSKDSLSLFSAKIAMIYAVPDGSNWNQFRRPECLQLFIQNSHTLDENVSLANKFSNTWIRHVLPLPLQRQTSTYSLLSLPVVSEKITTLDTWIIAKSRIRSMGNSLAHLSLPLRGLVFRFQRPLSVEACQYIQFLLTNLDTHCNETTGISTDTNMSPISILPNALEVLIQPNQAPSRLKYQSFYPDPSIFQTRVCGFGEE